MGEEARKAYAIEIAEGAAEDLAALRPFYRRPILKSIDEQLPHRPLEETRNKKVLVGLVPPWDHVPPLRELRVGEYRIFYDVDETDDVVTIRAVRKKSADKRTEDLF